MKTLVPSDDRKNRLSLRNDRLEFKIPRRLLIILEEFDRIYPNLVKNWKISTCKISTLPRWEPMWQYLVKITNIQVHIIFIIPKLIDEVSSHAKGAQWLKWPRYIYIGSQCGRVSTQVQIRIPGNEGNVGEAGPIRTKMWSSAGRTDPLTYAQKSPRTRVCAFSSFVRTYIREEPAVRHIWAGWVWGLSDWSWRITDRFRGIYGIHLKWMKASKPEDVNR